MRPSHSRAPQSHSLTSDLLDIRSDAYYCLRAASKVLLQLCHSLGPPAQCLVQCCLDLLHDYVELHVAGLAPQPHTVQQLKGAAVHLFKRNITVVQQLTEGLACTQCTQQGVWWWVCVQTRSRRLSSHPPDSYI